MIRKAIIPAAGLGTRMLPATKAVPKEMLTVVDKPVIQYVVEEAIASGVTEVLIVISKGKQVLQDHFASNFPSAQYYQEKGKEELLEQLRSISDGCTIQYAEQEQLNGLGDAIYKGKDFAGDDPFCVLLGDTICDQGNSKPVIGQLIDIYNEHDASVTAIEAVAPELVSRYGIMSGQVIAGDLYKVEGWVEKPEAADAPSNLAIAARYVFTPRIFQCLEETEKGVNNEVQITDAMSKLLEVEAMYALRFEGQRFDVGNPLGLIKTNLHFGLNDPRLAEELQHWLRFRGKD